MFATVNLPGSQYFVYFGPATEKDCDAWLNKKEKALKEECGGLWFNAYAPALITSNKVARSWKYRDGTRVIVD